MKKNHRNRSHHISDPHKRHHKLRHPSNAADSSQHHKNCQNRKNKPALCLRHPEGHQKSIRNRICLRHIAHTKGGTHRKQGKTDCQKVSDPPIGKSPLHDIHWPPGHLTLFVSSPVFYRQSTLHQLCGHTGDTGSNHPEQSARPAQHHSCRHPQNISGADGSGQLRCQRGKGGNPAILPCLPTPSCLPCFFLPPSILQPKRTLQCKTQSADIQKPKPDRQINSCSQKKHQHPGSPHQIVYFFYPLVHRQNKSPLYRFLKYIGTGVKLFRNHSNFAADSNQFRYWTNSGIRS